MDKINLFNARRTLIIGDINTGKTARTLAILRRYLKAGWGSHITVIDLAPDPLDGVGGKMTVPDAGGLRYFTGPIVPPRLTAADADQALTLARANAFTIAELFARFHRHPTRILFVNDASLYLQAGHVASFQAVLLKAETVVINAYYGNSFPDSALTRREKRMVRELMALCDRIIDTSQ